MRKLEEAWEAFLARRGLLWALLLLPLSFLYGAASRLLRSGRPQAVSGLDIVCVGNLSVGGSGKTPLVLATARIFQKTGKKVAVLTRGYGKDEDRLLSRALPKARVFVGADRLMTARAAASAGTRVALMDDGFQRRHELARRLDILVLDWSRREVESHCLPAGRLREPLEAAQEADAVVVTHAPEDWNPISLKAGLPKAFRNLKVFRGDHLPLGLRELRGGRKPLSWLKGKVLTALSGLGNPLAFESMLRSLGAQVLPLRFPDHHQYAAKDLRLEKGSEAVLTTAKDAIKMEAFPKAPFPVLVLEIEMRVEPRAEFKRMLLG